MTGRVGIKWNMMGVKNRLEIRPVRRVLLQYSWRIKERAQEYHRSTVLREKTEEYQGSTKERKKSRSTIGVPKKH